MWFMQAFAKARAELREAQSELTNCGVEIDRYMRERDEALKEIERLKKYIGDESWLSRNTDIKESDAALFRTEDYDRYSKETR